MLKLTQKIDSGTASLSVTLPLDLRIKSRIKVTLDDGSEAGLFMPRGSILRDGDLVSSSDGTIVEVRAAPETVSTATCSDPHLLARVCYHLGNRHVPLQIEPGFVRYQHDHVLDEMVRGLGLSVVIEQVPFEPEPGAYGDYGHASGQGHHHGHAHHH
ncbi:MAG: urease accessory protein UreE [Chromatiales bacterium]|jgi:urease accessory protein